MPGCECSLLFVVSREGGVYKSEGLVWLQQMGNKAKTERALGLRPRAGREEGQVGLRRREEATWCSPVSS